MNILETIVAQKRLEVARLPAGPVTSQALQNARARRGSQRDFLAALRRPRAGDVALIAEVKKASPSAGVICPDFDPIRIARAYELGGASCLSVLTDEQFFQGSLAYLKQIREVVSLPLLRKDFIIDARQILEAIEWGADAILLIVAILDDDALRSLGDLARAAGLAVLVEVHDEAELERALASGCDLIGVNNRDLKSFKVDLGTTERLADRLRRPGAALPPPPPPPSPRTLPLLVAESGIHTRADVERLRDAGAGAILVGESLVKGGDIARKAGELLGIPAGS
jgi:indole-3-glycerol phosphate synthase